MNPRTLHKITYGMYIICSKKDGRYNGQIANALIQVTAEPRTIAIAINRDNLTHEYILQSGVFTVSVMDIGCDMKLIGKFGFKSGRNIDKFEGIDYKIGQTGVPIVLNHALAFIEAKVIDKIDIHTHTIFIGEVVDAEILNEDDVMTYSYYHLVKGGKSPKNAPTYIAEQALIEQPRKEANLKKYECNVCGYIYDPALGDQESGIPPGTSFEDLPDDWVCPVCGIGKEEFSPFH